MNNRKNEILEYLKIMEWKLIDMFSTLSIIRKLTNVNYKSYVNKELNEELDSGDTHNVKAILDSFKVKKLNKN